MPYIFIPLIVLVTFPLRICILYFVHFDDSRGYLLRVCLIFFMYNALINMDGCLLIDLNWCLSSKLLFFVSLFESKLFLVSVCFNK